MQHERHSGAHGAGHHPAVEQYLETILELEESGIVPMRARLVERLGVSAPSVSETVKRLEREEYLTLDDERVLHLTASGREYATSVLRRHRLAELLLVEVLKVPWSQVHEEACRLEHAISDNLEAHLVKLLGDPGMCPHGNPIPGSANVVETGPLQPLATVPPGTPCVVRRIDEHLQTQLTNMLVLEHGRLLPGQQVTVGSSQDGHLVLDVDGVSVELEREVAAEVYVSLEPLITRTALQSHAFGADAQVMRRLAAAAVALGLLVAPAFAGTSKALPGTACPAFPADNYWHADVSKLAVNTRSAQWLSHMSPTRKLHPDFGPSYGEQSVPYGIPITYVSGTHTKYPVTFDYASESDRVNYPLGADTRIEGGQMVSGDRHAILVDKTYCKLYETYATRHSGTRWYAGSGATWNLKSNALRPAGWTSADAAGALPILPGLLRYDEVAAGKVDHAIRFTTDVTDRRYLWPARHQAGSVTNPAYPPMGARFRLKAGYAIGSFRADTQVVLRAMKAYGLVLADNGSPWYFQGTSDTRWTSPLLDQLKTIPASAFEAVDTSHMAVASNSGQVR